MCVEQRSIDEVMLAYREARNMPEERLRRNLLDRCWAEDGTYTDLTSEVQGRDALAAHIGRFLSGGPSGRGIRADH